MDNFKARGLQLTKRIWIRQARALEKRELAKGSRRRQIKNPRRACRSRPQSPRWA